MKSFDSFGAEVISELWPQYIARNVNKLAFSPGIILNFDNPEFQVSLTSCKT
jgi:uncharacterized protein (DUF302 family)